MCERERERERERCFRGGGRVTILHNFMRHAFAVTFSQFLGKKIIPTNK